jgi:hypothetical protein
MCQLCERVTGPTLAEVRPSLQATKPLCQWRPPWVRVTGSVFPGGYTLIP